MIKIEEIKEEKLNENYRFRTYLKMHADEKVLDEQFKMLHNKYFKNFDCSKCRNCCKVLGVSMDINELNKICKKYHFDTYSLKNNILKENYGKYVAKPCPFLNDDNSCQIKDCLPESCRDYPYTNKEERLFSLLTIVNNSKVCPVVYEILEELKKIYNFK